MWTFQQKEDQKKTKNGHLVCFQTKSSKADHSLGPEQAVRPSQHERMLLFG